MGTIVSLVSLVSRNDGTTGTSPEYRENKGIKEYIPGAREHGRAYKGNMVLFVPLIQADDVRGRMSAGLPCGTRQPERAEAVTSDEL